MSSRLPVAETAVKINASCGSWMSPMRAVTHATHRPRVLSTNLLGGGPLMPTPRDKGARPISAASTSCWRRCVEHRDVTIKTSTDYADCLQRPVVDTPHRTDCAPREIMEECPPFFARDRTLLLLSALRLSVVAVSQQHFIKRTFFMDTKS